MESVRFLFLASFSLMEVVGASRPCACSKLGCCTCGADCNPQPSKDRLHPLFLTPISILFSLLYEFGMLSLITARGLSMPQTSIVGVWSCNRA